MLRVFLTVDIEVWPSRSDWQENGIGTDLEHCVYGVTPEGRYGLEYQLDVLNRYGLKAVCFVEPLFAHAVGFEHLQGIVDTIRRRGHEVQLHLHTEWLRVTDEPALPPGTDRTGLHMKDYDADVQELLVRHGLELLERCGVPPPCAFRAGNQAANLDTLRAVARVGLPFDSSYYVASRSECDLPGSGLLVQPASLEGVREFPITFFADWPGHHRPLQLCACSSTEIEGTLRRALREGWYAIVLLMHGFELVKRPRREGGGSRVSRLAVRRFHRLCEFLDRHRGEYRTAFFSEIDPERVPLAQQPAPHASPVHRTLWRMAEQIVGRAC